MRSRRFERDSGGGGRGVGFQVSVRATLRPGVHLVEVAVALLPVWTEKDQKDDKDKNAQTQRFYQHPQIVVDVEQVKVCPILPDT